MNKWNNRFLFLSFSLFISVFLSQEKVHRDFKVIIFNGMIFPISSIYLHSLSASFYIKFRHLRKDNLAPAGVAQWIECWPVNQKVTGSIPNQGTCLSCGPGPKLGAQERQPHIDISLLLYHPPFPSL